ncbi:unnamed protein product, partial [Brassica rapa subsp. narinosa]
LELLALPEDDVPRLLASCLTLLASRCSMDVLITRLPFLGPFVYCFKI